MGDDKMITLEEHLDKSGCDEQLKYLLLLLSHQAKTIKGAFAEKQEYAGTKNIHGDDQMELDKWVDSLLVNVLKESGLVKTIATEEQSEILEIITNDKGFGVTIDPLDGSSLIAVNLAVGTIIGVYENGDILQKGKNMCASMYILYGPLTVLVYTIKKGVHEFAMDDGGNFVLLRENVVMPEGKIYAPGGLRKEHTDKHAKFIQNLETSGHKLRYSGSFVADFHQILRYGGIFSYPATKDSANGKLRLLFEANPIGFLAREAGGEISTGHQDILEITPKSLDQRVPLYVGSKSKIKLLEKIMAEGK